MSCLSTAIKKKEGGGGQRHMKPVLRMFKRKADSVVVWPSSLHHIFDVVLLLKERGLQKPTSPSNGYATLMRPNKAESAVHGCLIPAQVVLVLRMRSVEATPRYWCNVATCCFISLLPMFVHRCVPMLWRCFGLQLLQGSRVNRVGYIFNAILALSSIC